MRLAIDNLDGLGAVDYSAVMATDGPAALMRTLNAASVCRVSLLLSGTALKRPVRRARLVLSSDNGTVLFTGYLANEPEVMTAGAGMYGDDTLLLLLAESDEWLLDQQGTAPGGSGYGVAGDALLRTLTSRTDPTRFSVSSGGAIRPLGLFAPAAGQRWSKNAATLASGSYASYRVLGGAVDLVPGGAVMHRISTDDALIAEPALRLRAAKALANDITVSGEKAPATYVTEIFQGDGSTTEFVLTAAPFHPTGRAPAPPFADLFAASGSLDERVWTVADPGAHISVGAAGLALRGGTGLDGETTLALQEPVELGGSVVLEMAGVALGEGSDGVLCGLCTGRVSRTNCVAGFNVRQSGGATVVEPLVNGGAAATAVTLATGHSYVLRARIFSAEMHRVAQTFYTMVDGVVEGFGGGLAPATVHVVLELVDPGLSSNTPATVLFDGVIPGAPAIGTFVPVNSVQLFGSVSSVRVTRGGPLRVASTSAAGVTWTRLLGAPGEGLDGELTGGRLMFFAGRTPLTGEQIRVTYRTTERAVARVQDAASIAAESSGGLPGVAQWAGHVLEPVARNAADCVAAAAALLEIATSRTAALEGEYAAANLSDIWPGDLVRLEQDGAPVSLMVREVEVHDQLALPEVLQTRIVLANDWAKPFAMQLSGAVASDVLYPVPVTATEQPAPANLSALTVVSVSGSVIQLDMGVTPPAGGGFEVRRRDGGFGPGTDPDLVVRSPVRGFSIPRTAQAEQLFLRMYDGSAAPVYSQVSAAVYTHVPVS